MSVDNINDEIVVKAKEGDEDSMRYICEQYKQFVYLKSRNYFLIGGDKDDILQEAMIGLVKAIRAYKPENDASFKTFASICIKRQLITAIKSANTQKSKALNSAVSIHGVSGNDSDNGSIKGIKTGSNYNPEEEYIGKEQSLALYNYLKENLSDFEYRVFQKMIEGYNYREISELLDQKAKAIDNAIQRIKKKSELWLKSTNKY